MSQQGKKAKINGLEQRKLSDFVGSLNVVMFAPEDLEIVKGTPGVRRRFLDMEIGQVAPGYLYHLQQYQRCWCSGTICSSSCGAKEHPPRRCWRSGTSSWQSMVLKSSKKETIHKETAKVG